MSKSLGDVLKGRNYSEPPEIRQIKEFVHAELGLSPKVVITSESYVIKVSSAAAAGALRAKIYKLQREMGLDKRLVIRIG